MKYSYLVLSTFLCISSLYSMEGYGLLGDVEIEDFQDPYLIRMQAQVQTLHNDYQKKRNILEQSRSRRWQLGSEYKMLEEMQAAQEKWFDAREKLSKLAADYKKKRQKKQMPQDIKEDMPN